MIFTDPADEGLMKVAAVCRFLSVSRTQVWKWLDDGTLPYVKLDRLRRIPRKAVFDFAARGKAG